MTNITLDKRKNMVYNSDITIRKRGKKKMIEHDRWEEYCYTMNHNYYGCGDNRQWLEDLENKQKESYEIEEIINDFFNNL